MFKKVALALCLVVIVIGLIYQQPGKDILTVKNTSGNTLAELTLDRTQPTEQGTLFILTSSAAPVLEKVSGENIGKQVELYYQQKLQARITIGAAIEGGTIMIPTGNTTRPVRPF